MEMTSDRVELLRILSNLDQSMAKVGSIVEHAQSYEGWQTAVDARAKLQDIELHAISAIRELTSQPPK